MKFLILLCLELLSSMLAYAVGDVFFAPNIQGHLRIYNKYHEEWDIRGCRYNIPNKTVYCEINVHYNTIGSCEKYVCLRYGSKENSDKCLQYDLRCEQYKNIQATKSYRLRIPITSFEYTKNGQCSLKYGSTFKYTFLHCQSWTTKKFIDSQTLCTTDNSITSGYLPRTLYYGTPKQRFDFITSSGCEFFAYYDVVTTTEI